MFTESKGKAGLFNFLFGRNFVCEFLLKVAAHLDDFIVFGGNIAHDFSGFLFADTKLSHGAKRTTHNAGVRVQRFFVVGMFSDRLLAGKVFVDKDAVKIGRKFFVDKVKKLLQHRRQRLGTRNLAAVTVTNRSIGKKSDATVLAATFAKHHNFRMENQLGVNVFGATLQQLGLRRIQLVQRQGGFLGLDGY